MGVAVHSQVRKIKQESEQNLEWWPEMKRRLLLNESQLSRSPSPLGLSESLDLLLATLSVLARSFWYSAASALAFATLFFFYAILARFLCKVK
ncbi:hypothetical protein CCACVL1_07285 [Corchorus capsularis]|uniref:Uncharacterized protein n=1 Tax=Corchorus capsularis TaxID=210143 RepID=A0A1R3J7I9_COCAP|nr:hypothetical protein CCACVL1_07285 [Corchorus capsularis]